MKLSTIICGLALRLVTIASAAPSSLFTDLQTLHDVDSASPINDPIPPRNVSTHTLNPRGYDPSWDYHGWGLVEIWTGGSSRKPINWGDLRGKKLSDTIFPILDAACPASTLPSGAGCCPGAPNFDGNPIYHYFWTNSLVSGDPEWKVDLRPAEVRVDGGCFHNEWARIRLMQLAADTLGAYTRRNEGYNCYDVPGKWKGIYCNVPQLVRVNMAAGEVEGDDRKSINMPIDHSNGREKELRNFMHIETRSSTGKFKQFGFTKGDLKPCKTRHLVDEVMDKYKDDLVQLFPKKNGWWHREAKVIIDGYKSCTDEL